MIQITIKDGPYQGARDVTGYNSAYVISVLTEGGWGWSIDYSSATADERHAWLIDELNARLFRAFMRGLPIDVDGVRYAARLNSTGDLFRTVSRVERFITDGGKHVLFESDDDQGLKIVTLAD